MALGQIETVPAGKYGKQYLEENNLWNTVKDKVIYAKDVKQVLNYVQKVMRNKDLYIKQIYIKIRKN